MILQLGSIVNYEEEGSSKDDDHIVKLKGKSSMPEMCKFNTIGSATVPFISYQRTRRGMQNKNIILQERGDELLA